MLWCELLIMYGTVTTCLFISVAIHGSQYDALTTACKILVWPLYLLWIFYVIGWMVLRRVF